MKEHTNIRLEEELKNDLIREAQEDHRTFTNYVELLLKTHPDRKKVQQIIAGNVDVKIKQPKK